MTKRTNWRRLIAGREGKVPIMTSSTTPTRRPLAAVIALAGLTLTSCSDTTTVEPDEGGVDTEGTEIEQQTNAPVYGVENGTEGGLDLDSGNVPGSPEEIAEDQAQQPAGRYNESLGEPDVHGDE